MAQQLIEVRFINPANGETLCDEFTKAASHQEAIELAMDAFSGGVGVINRIERMADIEQGKFVRNGAAMAWRYAYTCFIEAENLVMDAILFTEYKEREENN